MTTAEEVAKESRRFHLSAVVVSSGSDVGSAMPSVQTVDTVGLVPATKKAIRAVTWGRVSRAGPRRHTLRTPSSFSKLGSIRRNRTWGAEDPPPPPPGVNFDFWR